MAVAARAKELKHAAWLGRKRVLEAADRVAGSVRDQVFAVQTRLAPPTYAEGDYPDSFVDRSPKVTSEVAEEPLPRRVFCLWTGDNALTPNRAEALEQLREESPSLEVVLVTPDNLADWIAPDAPLPDAYWSLSFVHRSDFLRSYLMHHHGGGYADIKRDYGDLAPCFDRLAGRPDQWLLGYPERSAQDVSDEPGSIYRSLQVHHRRLPANGAFISRRSTPLTAEWFAEVSRRLDTFAPRLTQAPGNVLGDNPGYPVPWGAMQGATFQPACLKYIERVMVDERLRPSLTDYR
ncbi:hypothetical protein [Nocardioides sp.]|uniref:hypothetical protein n=1 Tax=Nocardioides sp. TaxID=35761 RepID=UPI0035B3F344